MDPVSINDLPPQYTPVEPLKLRSGNYKITWNTSEQPVVEEEIEILPEKTLHFQPEKRKIPKWSYTNRV